MCVWSVCQKILLNWKLLEIKHKTSFCDELFTVQASYMFMSNLFDIIFNYRWRLVKMENHHKSRNQAWSESSWNSQNMCFGGKSPGAPGQSSAPQMLMGAKLKWRPASRRNVYPSLAQSLYCSQQHEQISACILPVHQLWAFSYWDLPKMTRIASFKDTEWREINCVWSSVK